MLLVKIVNDGTGNREIGNYDYEVFVNKRLIQRGRVEGHLRENGWVALLRHLVNNPIVTQIVLDQEVA